MIIGRPKFVLASGSPRRLTLVNQIGIEPDALRPADIDEMPKKGELPRACANRLARGKAETALAAVKLDDELSGCLHPRRRHRGRGRPAHPAQGRPARRGGAMPAAAVRPQSPRPHRHLPGDAEGGLPPAADRDARALQAAVRLRHRGLSRLRRMARQGRRLRGAGAGRQLHRQDRRLLHQYRRPAAVRDRDAAVRRGLSDPFRLAQRGVPAFACGSVAAIPAARRGSARGSCRTERA